jgi:uncharacterized protein with PIN domain
MAETCEMSAGNFFEASLVIQTHHGESGLRDLDSLIATYKIQIVDFTEQQASPHFSQHHVMVDKFG